MDDEWFHIVGDQKSGPVSKEMLLARFKKSAAWRDEYVWRQGMTDWTKAGAVPELAVSPPPLPSLIPNAPSVAASTPGKPRSALTVAIWIIAAPFLLFAGWVVIFAISEAASDTESFASRSGLSISNCRDLSIRLGMRYDQADAKCQERLPKNK